MNHISDFIRESEYDSEVWRWKSAAVRKGAGNQCQICKRTDKITHVHHWCYVPGKKIDQYENWQLALLCEDCHEAMHQQLNVFRRMVFSKQTPRSFKLLNAALVEGLSKTDALTLSYAILGLMNRPGFVYEWAAKAAKELGEDIP